MVNVVERKTFPEAGSNTLLFTIILEKREDKSRHPRLEADREEVDEPKNSRGRDEPLLLTMGSLAKPTSSREDSLA